MNILRKIAISLCMTALALTANANDTPWYQVEILVFANEDPSVLDDEFWPQGLDVQHKGNSVKLRPPLNTSAAPRAYELLPTSSLLFNDEKQRINRYHSYRVLYHAGWLQPVKKRNSRPIHIRAGQMLDNGMYELEGYITVDRGRYLHFKPDLYHSRKLSNSEAGMLREFLTAGEQPALQSSEVVTDFTSTPNSNAIAPTSATSTSFLNIPEFLTVNLRQGRRMRSEEVHYLDHPLMGVLVLMLPVKSSAQR